MRLHEEILRLVVEGDDGDDRTLDTMTPKMAKHHLSLLKATYQRLGGWDKNASVYKKLVDQVLAMPEYKSHPLFQGVHSTDKWNVKDKPDATRDFTKPVDWEFVDAESLTDKGEVVKQVSKNQRLGFKRVTSNWGMNLAQQHWLGQDGEYHEMPADEKMKELEPAILVKAPKMELPTREHMKELKPAVLEVQSR